MPEADVTRKRSRSPSDSDQPKHKRANTGVANDSHRSGYSSAGAGDVKMESRADDTAASTPDAKGTAPDSATSADATAAGGDSATTAAGPAGAAGASAPSKVKAKLLDSPSATAASLKLSGRRKDRLEREKTFRCPNALCTKRYLNPNGLKYHMEKGTCTAPGPRPWQNETVP